jgi:hypothetical protein
MDEIFLSWSGNTGKKIATELRKLLPSILHIPSPFVSDIDIHAGRAWREMLDSQLRETNYVMFIFTPENIATPSLWMAYEAGAAMSNRNREILVLTLAFNVPATSVPNYLGEIHSSSFKEEDWKKLLEDLRKKIKKKSQETGTKIEYYDNFDDISFPQFWSDFEVRINRIFNEVESAHKDDSPGNFSNQGDADSIQKSIRGLSDYVVNIPRIETTINDFFDQFKSFESRLTPALRENGLFTSQVTSPSGDEERNRYGTSLNRLRNTVASIEQMGLLDDNTLQELKSALKDLA